MMKGRGWTTARLREVGETTGLGATFLEETFSAKTAAPTRRLHQQAARAVLSALLPAVGTEIKGQMLLCRKHHVETTAGTSVFEAILAGKRIPLRDRAPEIPFGLAKAIDRSLSLDIAARFASAEELRIALEPYSTKSNV
jgi:hypothetical protein